jgi:hypothetical protein
MRGYDDVKHPFFGNGTRDMVARQASRLCSEGGCVAAAGAGCVGAARVDPGAGWAEAVKHDKNPGRKPAIAITRRIPKTPTLSDLDDFMVTLQRLCGKLVYKRISNAKD